MFCFLQFHKQGEYLTHAVIVRVLIPDGKQIPDTELPERELCTQARWPVCLEFVYKESQAWWLMPIILVFSILKQKLHKDPVRKERKKGGKEDRIKEER